MENNVPTGEYKPLSPWAYWGLSLLFSVPVVGLVFLIIFSIKKTNINRRNFARSYWISLILMLIIIGIFIAIVGVSGGIEYLQELLSQVKIQ